MSNDIRNELYDEIVEEIEENLLNDIKSDLTHIVINLLKYKLNQDVRAYDSSHPLYDIADHIVDEVYECIQDRPRTPEPEWEYTE